MPTVTTSELTVTRRPRYRDSGADLTYDDFLIVVNGNVIGGSGWIADSQYDSWGLLHFDGHPTREAAEQVQVDAVLAAHSDVLDIRIDADGVYRVAIGGGQNQALAGGIVQEYLGDAARCAAVVTGTQDGFTIDHTADCHASRACEHDGQVLTYRPTTVTPFWQRPRPGRWGSTRRAAGPPGTPRGARCRRPPARAVAGSASSR